MPSAAEFDSLVSRVNQLAANLAEHTHATDPAPDPDPVPDPDPEPGPDPAPVTLDDNDIVYTGTWSTSTGSDKYGGGDHHTATKGATASVRFSGTRVQLIGATDAHHGRASVQLDQLAPVTIDQRSASRRASVQFFDSGELADTDHTLTLTVEGDGTVALDKVNLNGAPTQPVPEDPPPTPADPNAVFTVSGNRVLRNGEPWWFLGYNSFVWSANCGHDHEKMSVTDVEEWFASMRHDGHGLVRLFFFRGWNYDRLDAAIASAKRHNVYLIVTLDDAIGGCGENDKTDGWFNSDAERSDFSDHLTTLLTRYKGENQIFAFEYFNEPSYRGGKLRSFYDEMGKVRDAIDPSRLMSSGTVAPYWLDGENNFRHVHESPGVDIASLHEYDQDEVLSNHLDNAVNNAAGKPLIVGEFGIAANSSGSGCKTSFGDRANRFRAKAEAYIHYDGCFGALAWAWQPGSSDCGYGSLDRDEATQTVLREVTK